jgi:hypothetical protein
VPVQKILLAFRWNCQLEKVEPKEMRRALPIPVAFPLPHAAE